jgi:hypothetical protein
MRKLTFLFFLSIVPVLVSGQYKNGYELNVTIHGLRDSTVYLAYHYGDKQYIKDTIVLDNSGRGKVSGKETLPEGIYMIVLPGRKYFEILISKNQFFSVECSYSDYLNTLRFDGSDENSAFVTYQRNWMKMQQQATAIAMRVQNNKQNKDSLNALTPIQKSQEEKMKAYLKSVISANNGTLLAILVKSMLPLDIPDFKIPAGTPNPDSVRWIWNYNYNKNHFFDNIDLTDEKLLRTPILYARLEAFFTNVVIQSPDSIKRKLIN